jgi:type I restriction enzyme S subunit
LYLTCKNFKDGKLDLSKASYIIESDYSKHFKSESNALTKPTAGDVLFSIIGTIGEPYLYKDEDFFGISSSVSILRPNNSLSLHSSYLYYWIKNREFQKAVIGMKGGVAQGYLSLDMIRALPIRYPSLPSQEKIAFILSAYDDLIENNRRRIQLLEQAARLLYREWFVYFRFPGHEHVTITDGVPEGWEKKTLSKVLFELESGGRPKGGAQEDGIPSVGAENVIGIGQYDYSKEKYVPETYFKSMRKGIIQSRDVLVYKDGANIGRSSYFGDGYPHETCAVNEHVFILRASPQVGQNLLYFWVERDETRQHIANLNANTAQPGVSQSKLKTLDFVVPQDRITSIFNETVEPIVRQIFLLAKEIQALINARDLLLPRLMNGEVAV